jgi:hypothetical protein
MITLPMGIVNQFFSDLRAENTVESGPGMGVWQFALQ